MYSSSYQEGSRISDRPINEPRLLKVIYIGAGISGIVAAIEFLKTVPTLELVIYEKNPEVGGTWYENKYPGCACDNPSHGYQLSFESWTDWSQFYAGSSEILNYWKRVAEKYDIKKHIRFRHKCLEARWDDLRCKWTVKLERDDLAVPQIIEDSADVLITGTGLLNEWKWPSIPGLQTFQGHLLHTANWDDGFNPDGKRVAVIGAGSSGIQVVPALVDKVKSMDHYVRGKTWISPQLSEDILKQNAAAGTTNFNYTREQMDGWKQSPEAYVAYRKSLDAQLQSLYEITQSGSARHNDARRTYETIMRQRLGARSDVLDVLLPDYAPLCKRLTPGPGYLEALIADHVTVIPRTIAGVDETSITTEDGIRRPVDAIICATGFETAPGSGFPVLGLDNVNLRTKQAFRPKTYLGLCTNNFPNFFQSLGPNSWQGAGSLLITIEHTHRYMAKILKKMIYGNVRTIQPKKRQVDNFTTFCQQYFKRTVYTAECASWYKTVEPSTRIGERKREQVTALWPGSCLHALNVFSDVRWEDFEMEYEDGNDFGWFGNGSTVGEIGGALDTESLTWYLNDFQFLHEKIKKPRGAQVGERKMVQDDILDTSHIATGNRDVVPVEDDTKSASATV